MGKRVKKKERRPVKEKQASSPSPRTGIQQSDPSLETVVNEAPVVVERRVCPHFDKVVDFTKISLKITSSDSIRCEDCRDGALDRKSGKGKGKQGKKKGAGSTGSKSEKKAIWVCLECGHFSCGGVGLPTNAQSHAVRHVRQTRHHLVIQYENPHLRWCFPCSTLIPLGKSEDILSDVVKSIKDRSLEVAKPSAEEIWFGSGSVKSETKTENTVSSGLETKWGYVARGLTNLGNTCFFNSVMQNLLAIGTMRGYFLNQDGSKGPLTVALKKLYVETDPGSGSRNAVNPRSFFGCVCVKAPQFRGYQQHDSHELLRCLLDGLSMEELSLRKHNSSSTDVGPTFVDAVFGGQLSSTVCCLECGHSSTVHEPFLDISLSVPTKKPPPKKPQPVSRARKSKLPPKRVSRVRSKVKDSDPNSSAITESSSQTQQDPPVGETVVDSSGDHAPLEPTEKEASSLEDSMWLDFLEPNTMTDGQDATSTFQASSSLNEEPKLNLESDTNSWEDELPPRIHGPYKEGTSNTGAIVGPEAEADSSFVGGEQDPEGFDGFGDLFNEPEAEVTMGPAERPASSDNNISGNGFVAGNSSESDPDEVDNSNSPVSIESCLAYFTKPELLSEEHAWHCDKCSKKVTLEARKNKLKPPCNGNGNKDHKLKQSMEEQCDVINIHVEISNSSGCYKTCTEASFNEQTSDSCCADEPSVTGGGPDEVQTELVGPSREHMSGESEEDESDSECVKVKRDATKRILINKAPPVLTIHLKRFSQDDRGRLSKLNGHIDFRETLDLRPYMDPRCVERENYDYRLVGVVEHLGTMRGGHYVAFVRGAEKENDVGFAWYHTSDAYVRETSLDEVLRCEGYILFYEKI